MTTVRAPSRFNVCRSLSNDGKVSTFCLTKLVWICFKYVYLDSDYMTFYLLLHVSTMICAIVLILVFYPSQCNSNLYKKSFINYCLFKNVLFRVSK